MRWYSQYYNYLFEGQWKDLYTVIEENNDKSCRTKDGKPVDIEIIKQGDYLYKELIFECPLFTKEKFHRLVGWVEQEKYCKPIVIHLRKLVSYNINIPEEERYIIIGEQKNMLQGCIPKILN